MKDPFVNSFQAIDTQRINWKSDTCTRSIAQIIDHLMVIKEILLQGLSSMETAELLATDLW